MTISIYPADIIALGKINGQNITASCNGVLNIGAKISLLNVKMELSITASDTLNININKGLIAGINFTGLVRNKVFNLLKVYNNDKYSFSLDGTTILLKVAGVQFKNVVITDCVELEVQV